MFWHLKNWKISKFGAGGLCAKIYPDKVIFFVTFFPDVASCMGLYSMIAMLKEDLRFLHLEGATPYIWSSEGAWTSRSFFLLYAYIQLQFT